MQEQRREQNEWEEEGEDGEGRRRGRIAELNTKQMSVSLNPLSRLISY